MLGGGGSTHHQLTCIKEAGVDVSDRARLKSGIPLIKSPDEDLPQETQQNESLAKEEDL